MFCKCYNKMNITGEGLGYLGFTAPDGPGSDGSGLLVPAEDFGDAPVRDAQLSGNDARTDPVMRHFYDLVADVVG